jgi:hypothetical protein
VVGLPPLDILRGERDVSSHRGRAYVRNPHACFPVFSPETANDTLLSEGGV